MTLHHNAQQVLENRCSRDRLHQTLGLAHCWLLVFQLILLSRDTDRNSDLDRFQRGPYYKIPCCRRGKRRCNWFWQTCSYAIRTPFCVSTDARSLHNSTHWIFLISSNMCHHYFQPISGHTFLFCKGLFLVLFLEELGRSCLLTYVYLPIYYVYLHMYYIYLPMYTFLCIFTYVLCSLTYVLCILPMYLAWQSSSSVHCPLERKRECCFLIRIRSSQFIVIMTKRISRCLLFLNDVCSQGVGVHDSPKFQLLIACFFGKVS